MRTKCIVALIVCLCLCVQAVAKKNNLATEALKLLGSFAIEVLANVAAGEIGKHLEDPKSPAPPPANTARSASQPLPYAFTLAWNDPENGILYVGYLKMRGRNGFFRVSVAGQISVDQLMTAGASPNGRDIILTGSFPRIAGTLRPMPDYSSDRFRLTQSQPGVWTIADTCDYKNKCAPVAVLAAAAGSAAE